MTLTYIHLNILFLSLPMQYNYLMEIHNLFIRII